jgi:hypothetical protein
LSAAREVDPATAVRRWVEDVVIDLNLCPFAKRELLAERVRFDVTDASTETELLEVLASELDRLVSTPSIETTLIIHPHVLSDFLQYNQFLDIADRLLVQLKLEGVIQIASFHPDYQFADTQPDDPENFTNRSPFPILHLLREDSLEKAIASTADIDQVPIRNIATMQRLGVEALRSRLRACLQGIEDNASTEER